MQTKILLVTIFSIIVIVGTVLFNSRSSQFCSETDEKLRKLLDDAKICNADSDCTILTLDRHCSCPDAYNKNVDLKNIENLAKAYANKCDSHTNVICEPCFILPEYKFVCKENKCYIDLP